MNTQSNLLAAGILLASLANGFGQPVITNQPLSQTNIQGSVVTLTVGATGTLPLYYQWRRGAGNLSGATNAALVIASLQNSNEGNYTVVVTNIEGSVTSMIAYVRILRPPAITTQPTNFPSVSLGANVSNRVSASGTAPLNYQWRRDDMPLVGMTNATLVLANLQLTDAGDYSVAVSNAAGSTNSQVARLNVDPTFTKITTGPIVTDRDGFWNGAWGDYDNDGFVDLFVGGEGNGRDHHLYRNNGDRTFTAITAGPVVTDGRTSHNSHGASWADFDNDGYLDLFVSGGNPFASQSDVNKLYRNNGDGTFQRLTNGLFATELGLYHGCSWGDYDNDGWVDLFIVRHVGKNVLYRNNGDGAFVKITAGPIVNDVQGFSESCAWADYDNDGDLDLFVTNAESSPNFLYRNDGNGSFTKITNGSIVTEINRSLGTAWGDYNNDGHLDLYVCNGYASPRPNSLFRNNGDGTFSKVTNDVVATEVVSGAYASACAWADYDNDGYLDLFVTRFGPSSLFRNSLYHNNGDGTFSKITEGSLVNDAGESGGCAWADYDNDGFQDLFVSNGPAFSPTFSNYLYRNNGNSNRWITVRLVGTVSNRAAIGAKVRVRATISGRRLWQMREVSGGSGAGCFNDLRASFGLGDATNVDLVRIEWPSGIVQEFRDVALMRFLTVTEPPRLLSARIASTMFSITVKGGRGMQYYVQRSSNAWDWVPAALVTVANFDGTTTFSEPADVNTPVLFYRAVTP